MIDISELQIYLDKTRNNRKKIIKFAEEISNRQNFSKSPKAPKIRSSESRNRSILLSLDHLKTKSKDSCNNPVRVQTETPKKIKKHQFFEKSFNTSKKEVLESIYSRDSPRKTRPFIQIPVSRLSRFKIPENLIEYRSVSPTSNEIKTTKSTSSSMFATAKPS